MKLEVWKCDGPKCEKQFDLRSGKTVEFRLCKYKDITTGDWETDIKRADLCTECLHKLLQNVLGALQVDMRTTFAAVWGAKG